MKRVWVDDWVITYDGTNQYLTGIDRYRHHRIAATLAYTDTWQKPNGWIYSVFIGRDGRRYVLGRKSSAVITPAP